MLGLTYGELFVVVFVTLAVVSARFWPQVGAAIFEFWARRRPSNANEDEGKP